MGPQGAAGSSSSGFEHSGSRLKANVLTAADGTTHLLGWHDTQLDVDCAFGLASDDVMRCLPSTNIVATPGYTDSTCMHPIALQQQGGCGATVPSYAIEYTSDCTPRMAVWTVTGVGEAYYGCSFVPTGGYTVWVLGDTIDPSTFVAGTVSQQ
jgi:hypothetical protein